MQFQCAAPLLAPFRVQEQNQIQPAMKLRKGMVIEIYVRIEILPVQVFVRAAAKVLRIVEQVRNAGDASHELQERPVAQQPVQTRVCRSQLRQVCIHCFPALLTELVARLFSIESRKLRHQLPAELGG